MKFLVLLCSLIFVTSIAQNIQDIDLGDNQSISYNLDTGEATYENGNASIVNFYAEVHLPETVTSKMYTERTYLQEGNIHTITLISDDLPTMYQIFEEDSEEQIHCKVIISSDTEISSNYLAPIVCDGTASLSVGTNGDNIRSMLMPSFQPNTQRWSYPSVNSTGLSYNVTSFYDGDTQEGFVIGALTHDIWKSGIQFEGANQKVNQLAIISGVMNEWDVVAHGTITSTEISSAEFLLGFYDDFKDGLEKYALAIAEITPKLTKSESLAAWDYNTVFSWKSWGNGAGKANFTVEDFFQVPDLLSDNLHSEGWHNEDEKIIIHIAGQTTGNTFIGFSNVLLMMDDVQANHPEIKMGSYYSPFVFNIEDADKTYKIGYTYGEAALKDHEGNYVVVYNLSNNPKYILDATHPATIKQLEDRIRNHKNYGFEFIRFDFLQYGIMEGNFYEETITTGVQAYNYAMQKAVDMAGGTMHINMAIGPYFPHQYAHSKRISGDTKWEFDTVEYELNALAGGWWLGNGVLYDLLDPGDVDFNPNPEEEEVHVSISKMNNAVVTGYCQTSDDITDGNRLDLHKKYFTDPDVLEVLKLGKSFKPLNISSSNTPNVYYHLADDQTMYLGIFNHSETDALVQNIDLSQIIDTSDELSIFNVWEKTTSTQLTINTWDVSLEAKESKLYKITSESSLSNKRSLINEKTFAMTPNPSNGKINIKVPEGTNINTIELRNLLGQLVYSNSYQKNTTSCKLNLESFSNGIYFVSITTNSNTTLVQKLILQ